MRIELPIFQQITEDLKLPVRAFQVFRASIKHLDVVQWRELSLSGLALAMDVEPSTVMRAVKELVDRGYLCRREQGLGMAALYRVPLSRGFGVDPVAWPDEDVPVAEAQPVPVKQVGPRVIGRGVA